MYIIYNKGTRIEIIEKINFKNLTFRQAFAPSVTRLWTDKSQYSSSW